MSQNPRLLAPSFDAIWPKVQESAAQLDSDTSSIRGWNSKSFMQAAPGFLTVILIFVAMGTIFAGKLLAGIVLIIIAAAIGIPAFRSASRKLSEATTQHQDTVMRPIIEQLIEQVNLNAGDDPQKQLSLAYEPTRGIPVPVLRQAGFIRDSAALQEDFFHGSLGQTEFMLSDVKWQTSKIELSEEAKKAQERRLERERRAREGELRREHGENWRFHDKSDAPSIPDFLPESVKRSMQQKLDEIGKPLDLAGPSMVVFTADFHKDFSSSTYLLPRKIEDRAFRNFTEQSAEKDGLEPMQLEDVGITQKFVGWTSDQLEARYLLTPQLMLAISDAVERMGSELVGVSFNGSRMYFAVVLNENRFSFQLADHKDNGYTAARAVYEDMVSFLSLVEDFNLNTRIWSKQ